MLEVSIDGLDSVCLDIRFLVDFRVKRGREQQGAKVGGVEHDEENGDQAPETGQETA